MNQLTSIQLLDMAIGTELGTAKEAEAEAHFHALGTLVSRWLLARSDYPKWRQSSFSQRSELMSPNPSVFYNRASEESLIGSRPDWCKNIL
jgi:hypothetical protein